MHETKNLTFPNDFRADSLPVPRMVESIFGRWPIFVILSNRFNLVKVSLV